MSERAQRLLRHRATEEHERWIMIAIAIGLVALIPSIVLGVLLWREIDHRTAENATLIQRIQRNSEVLQRHAVQVRKAIRQADIENCREDEVVKARLRSIVAFDPAEVRLTLEKLGIDPDSQRGQDLMARSRAQSEEAIGALRARDCSKLPDPTNPSR